MFHLFFILSYYAMTTIDSSSYDDDESRDRGEMEKREEKTGEKVVEGKKRSGRRKERYERGGGKEGEEREWKEMGENGGN